MSRARLLAGIAVALVAASAGAQGAASPVDPQCARLLPLAEAERLTGLKPLTPVGRFEVQYAGGTCNYVVGSEKTLVMLFSVSSATPKSMDEFRSTAKWAGGSSPLPGLGDEALKANGSLAFRKGKTAVSVGSFVDIKTGGFFVSNDALLAVAKAIEKKL